MLHSFTGGSYGGAHPIASVAISSDGVLYGTTKGAIANAGTVFALKP